MTLLTAVDLIRQFLELRTLVPDLDDWEDDRLADNLPRLYRLRRIRALFRAYGIDCSPAAFMDGGFIDPDDERYSVLAERMEPLLAEHHLRPGFIEELGHGILLRRSFRDLLQYREKLEDALTSGEGISAVSGWYALTFFRMRRLNGLISQQLWVVDDILAAIVSPEGESFPLAKLTTDYGYPAVDLRSIDEDWT